MKGVLIFCVMRKLRAKFVLLVISALFLLNIDAKAQCKQQFVYECASMQGVIFQRDFNIKLKLNSDGSSGTKFSQFLNKGSRYRFRLCVPDEIKGDVVLTLFDGAHPELSNPYASTFDKTTKKDREYFDFICNRTAVYYLSIRYKDGKGSKKGSCAVCSLFFVGKQK